MRGWDLKSSTTLDQCGPESPKSQMQFSLTSTTPLLVECLTSVQEKHSANSKSHLLSGFLS